MVRVRGSIGVKLERGAGICVSAAHALPMCLGLYSYTHTKYRPTHGARPRNALHCMPKGLAGRENFSVNQCDRCCNAMFWHRALYDATGHGTCVQKIIERRKLPRRTVRYGRARVRCHQHSSTKFRQVVTCMHGMWCLHTVPLLLNEGSF